MIIDITLAIIFIVSLFTLWYRVSVKIPELVAIPDQVITERLEEDSARLRLFVLHFKAYWKEKRYRDVFWGILSKGLYRFHILLLRLDNKTVAFLQGVRAHAGVINGNGSGDGLPSQASQDKILAGKYWKKLQQDSTSPAAVKDNRIREVRVKK